MNLLCVQHNFGSQRAQRVGRIGGALLAIRDGAGAQFQQVAEPLKVCVWSRDNASISNHSCLRPVHPPIWQWVGDVAAGTVSRGRQRHGEN